MKKQFENIEAELERAAKAVSAPDFEKVFKGENLSKSTIKSEDRKSSKKLVKVLALCSLAAACICVIAAVIVRGMPAFLPDKIYDLAQKAVSEQNFYEAIKAEEKTLVDFSFLDNRTYFLNYLGDELKGGEVKGDYGENGYIVVKFAFSVDKNSDEEFEKVIEIGNVTIEYSFLGTDEQTNNAKYSARAYKNEVCYNVFLELPDDELEPTFEKLFG